MPTETIRGTEFTIELIDASTMGGGAKFPDDAIRLYYVDRVQVSVEEFARRKAEALAGFPVYATYGRSSATIRPWNEAVPVWCLYCGRQRMSDDRGNCLGCGASKVTKTEPRWS